MTTHGDTFKVGYPPTLLQVRPVQKSASLHGPHSSRSTACRPWGKKTPACGARRFHFPAAYRGQACMPLDIESTTCHGSAKPPPRLPLGRCHTTPQRHSTLHVCKPKPLPSQRHAPEHHTYVATLHGHLKQPQLCLAGTPPHTPCTPPGIGSKPLQAAAPRTRSTPGIQKEPPLYHTA
jgi:hypothetical protein